MEQAKRFNQGKVTLSLLPAKACIEEAKVWQFGEQKYGRDNWRKLYGSETINKVMDSLMRHAMAILDGQLYDPETGLDHAAHIRCNAAMIIEYNQTVNNEAKVNTENDVRYNIKNDAESGLKQVVKYDNTGTGHYVWTGENK